MTQERHPQPDQAEQERRRDQAWIQTNRVLFWLVAGTAYEEVGWGVLAVNLVHKPLGRGHPFSYYAEGELEEPGPELRRSLQEYDPGREFIILLLKSGGRTDVYKVDRPPIGWMADLETQTRYEEAGPDA